MCLNKCRQKKNRCIIENSIFQYAHTITYKIGLIFFTKTTVTNKILNANKVNAYLGQTHNCVPYEI